MAQKIKTLRGAAKRFKKTANGFKRKQAFKRRGCTMVADCDVPSVQRMLPNT